MSHEHSGMDPSSPASGPSGSDDMPMNMIHMMQMTFYSGKNTKILFSGWKTDDAAEYVFSLLAIFCIAAFHEWLSTFRVGLESTVVASKNANGLKKPFLFHRLLLTFLYALNAVTRYALMLMAMTFNVGIFIVIIAGLTIAHFFFRTFKKDSPSEAGLQV